MNDDRRPPGTLGASSAPPANMPPGINLPKGGGALRGMGEKFAAVAASGAASMSVPIAISPGRSGFGPELGLTYDSASGNGPFGFGWRMSVPTITRKTEKGLPRYADGSGVAPDSDVYVLSGHEDLVPELDADGVRRVDDHSAPGYVIHRYRPRVEGLFSRIERWTDTANREIHWRSITRDNVVAVYGRDNTSRIFDPAELHPHTPHDLAAAHPHRIFSWLVSEMRDDKGNAVVFDYKPEDGVGVNEGLACEGCRGPRDDPRRTANRYLKRIRYGNRRSLLDGAGHRPRFVSRAEFDSADWMFEVVLDYGEHDTERPRPDAAGQWDARGDPFSNYRAGFEVRTSRLCRRVLMFHHFADYDGLVNSTDFGYGTDQSSYTLLTSVQRRGYRRDGNGYVHRAIPKLEFEYSTATVADTIEDVDPQSLENAPAGLEPIAVEWTDLHGEGLPGILREDTGGWRYKRNLSPVPAPLPDGRRQVRARFAPLETVATKPNTGLSSGARFLDLAGDGRPKMVLLDGPTPGIYDHDDGEGWRPFRPFGSRLNRDTRDPNVRLIDLDGDGRIDVLVTEDDALVWHESAGGDGFGPARRSATAHDEDKGARLVFADAAESIYTADMSGDGLTDLVRIRNGEVCYWPNLGYGRFGAKVTMDFEDPEELASGGGGRRFDDETSFDQKRVRLADIDGSGPTDLIYLHRDGVRLYANRSGNSLGRPTVLDNFPPAHDAASIVPADLLGNGTVCLVWSSPLPGDGRRSMRYLNLVGSRKPHLLIGITNNMGARTHIEYAPSTRFYLQDKYDGTPWATRLPFCVHVVEHVEQTDLVSRTRFTSRYAYHHGHFDEDEREFRGFGRVDRWDTEEIGFAGPGVDGEASSYVPPVYTRTWYHTGAYPDESYTQRIAGEWFREPGGGNALLGASMLPDGFSATEERDACRALKGAMLRSEVFALDSPERPGVPYAVTEHSFTVTAVQRRGPNRHGVFFTSPREALNYHYERHAGDPRVTHTITLAVDPYGNTLQQADIGYGRRLSDPALPVEDHPRQTSALMVYAENVPTDPVDDAAHPDDYRTPMPGEARTYEVTGVAVGHQRLSVKQVGDGIAAATALNYEEVPTPGSAQLRLIDHVRTVYRRDNLTGQLELSQLEPKALPGNTFRLAFTPAMVANGYGDRVTDTMLANEAGYVHSGGDGNWWIPSGQVRYSPADTDTAAQELSRAHSDFFVPCRFRDPFGETTTVSYDADRLLVERIRDPVGNTVTAVNDYRLLAPTMVTDPNGCTAGVRCDALGMVVGTVFAGKAVDNQGDSFENFTVDLSPDDIAAYFNADDPRPLAVTHLGSATSRFIYDLGRVPVCAAGIARQTHVSDLDGAGSTQVQVQFSYSDGSGHEIQRKRQAEPGPVPMRDADGGIVIGANGQPQMSEEDAALRWVGSGWTVLNNKGAPVRQFEPFFTDTHRHEFDVRAGASPWLFYDPLGRVVVTLHPDRTWERVVFDAWQQTTFGRNDTVGEPVPECFSRIPDSDHSPTWYELRTQPAHAAALAARYPDPDDRANETIAAQRAVAQADTPATAHLDTLGRSFMTVSRHRVVCDGHPLDGQPDQPVRARTVLDIEGNTVEVRDERRVPDAGLPGATLQQRVLLRSTYHLLGGCIHQLSMDAGRRWRLTDVLGKTVRTWDSRGHSERAVYDPLRRLVATYVTGLDPADPDEEFLTERLVYGEQHPDATAKNLRGRTYLVLDQSGEVTHDRFDFKGNALTATRRLAREYRDIVDWAAVDAVLPDDAAVAFDPATLNAALAPALAESYLTRMRFDAMNRLVQTVAPHRDDPAAPVDVIQCRYNEADLLDRAYVWLRRAGEPAELIDPAVEAPAPVGIADVDYDAEGQRTYVDYTTEHADGLRTNYTYDRSTHRMTALHTRRGAAVLQDLHYTYDAAGNVTHVRDGAQQDVFFDNHRVQASADYVYDALGRLVSATGREHLGQAGGPLPHSYNDSGRIGIVTAGAAGTFAPGDGTAMGSYREHYVYDAVGNLLQMRHARSDAAAPGWTRTHDYHEASTIEPGKHGNRLTRTALSAAGDVYSTAGDGYDAHGNMQRMPQLQAMRWDWRDRLRSSRRQKVDDDDADGVARHGEQTWYVYNAAGQRVRKVTEQANGGGIKEERVYLNGFELYRRHSGADAGLVRESLHISDGEHRIALVETRNAVDDGSPVQLIRYQLGNHLGSAVLELDERARIISYEEYAPYGSTTYQAVRSKTEAPKRYRSTRMERDEESGLYYHGARYYAPWLGRWVSADPAGLKDGPNLYAYARGSPVQLVDRGGHDASDGDLTEWAKSSRGSYNQPGHVGTGLASLAKPPPRQASIAKQKPAAKTVPSRPRQAAKPKPPPTMSDAESMQRLKDIAAALQPRLIYPKEVTQAKGVAQVVGGGLELVGAVYSAETGVGPLLLGAHGLDQIQTGARTAWTGEESRTLVFYAASGASFAVNDDPKMAMAVGSSGDTVAGLAAGLYGLKAGAAEIGVPEPPKYQMLMYHGNAPGGQHVVTVDTPTGPRAFYRRTGGGGRNAGGAQPGDWAPFDGFASRGGVFSYEEKVMQSEGPGWMVKHRYSYGMRNNDPLYRWGTVENQEIAEWLKTQNIPLDEGITDWQVIQGELEFYKVPTIDPALEYQQKMGYK